MNFNYQIQNIIPEEQRAFVVYTLEDQPNNPKGAWIYVNTFHPNAEEVRQAVLEGFPISAFDIDNAVDTEEQIKETLAEILVGSGTYTPRMAHPGDIATFQLSRRNLYLQDTDWTQLPDVALSEEYKLAYKVYRQRLRDITSDPEWPMVSFPMPEVHFVPTEESLKAQREWEAISAQFAEQNNTGTP